jgi:SAM-dependent methyltransferase
MRKLELSDSNFINEQYSNADKISCRIEFHSKYSENKYGWHKWVFDQLALFDDIKVIEVGCGPGTLWTTNLTRIPPKCRIFLSDLSIGIVQSAINSFHGLGSFNFLVLNAQEIPLQTAQCDAIIANHMIYHLPDKDKALLEMKRILKPGGKLYASTVGVSHLKEITDLVNRYNPALAWWKVSNTFLLDGGKRLLSRWFPNVEQRRYIDSLLVDNPDDLARYILSGTNEIVGSEIHRFHEFIRHEFDKCGGVFRISKDSGLFIAS